MDSELLRVVEQEAESERLRILEEAREQAMAIINQAEARAAEIRQDFECRAGAEESEALAKAKSAADLEASAIVLRAKSRILSLIFDQALAAMRMLPVARRRQVLTSLICEVARELGPGMSLQVAPDDAGTASEIVKELKLEAEVIPDGEVDGGVVAKDATNSILICNSFSDRLSQAWPNLLPEITGLLWGNDG